MEKQKINWKGMSLSRQSASWVLTHKLSVQCYNQISISKICKQKTSKTWLQILKFQFASKSISIFMFQFQLLQMIPTILQLISCYFAYELWNWPWNCYSVFKDSVFLKLQILKMRRVIVRLFFLFSFFHFHFSFLIVDWWSEPERQSLSWPCISAHTQKSWKTERKRKWKENRKERVLATKTNGSRNRRDGHFKIHLTIGQRNV